MRRIFTLMLCFLHFGCMDYVLLEDKTGLSAKAKKINFRPWIDTKHVNPQPSRLLIETISVGSNCTGQAFKVPPIYDQNNDDRLYYLWFLDNKLVWPERPPPIIEPESRASGVIVFNIDNHFLNSHFKTKIPANFFDHNHIIEFFVSDKPYTIPESRYIDEATDNEKKHGDHVYWIASFSNDPC